MLDSHVVRFFYGSYINPAALREVDLLPERFDVARLAGFDIVIRPSLNLVPSESSVFYGVLASATHDELGRLYAQHETSWVASIYLGRSSLRYSTAT